MRALLDTNVLVSAVLFDGLPQDRVERAFHGEFELVTSEAMLDELERVLRVKFARPPTITRALREELSSLADVRRPAEITPASRDPADDMVLAAALDGNVDSVVTGDRDLLALGTYEGIRILTVRQFAALLTDGPAKPGKRP